MNRSIIDNSPLDPPEPPHVTPSYYAGILVNSLIGNSVSAKVTELPVPDENVSGYAVYEGNTLKRAVFVNLHAWLLSSTGFGHPFTSISYSAVIPVSAALKQLRNVYCSTTPTTSIISLSRGKVSRQEMLDLPGRSLKRRLILLRDWIFSRRKLYS